MIKYFTSSIWVTLGGLALAGGVGYYYQPHLSGVLQALFTVVILSILEVSISFDNAVVNASVLQKMTPLWQHRFITWGMLIAVFGMRLIFPLLVVGIMAHLSPWQALSLAAFNPKEYAEIMLSVHHEVSAFGGAFLMLVAFHYFFDQKKELHWLQVIEKPLAKMGRLEAVEVGLVLLLLVILSRFYPPDHALSVLLSGMSGIICFLVVEGIATFLHDPGSAVKDVAQSNLAMFLYLEVLDASFSFDGVVGAFAITNNLFIIAIGLGVGAMFVRSLTILMVERGTLKAFRYLEHGAFYAVLALALIMFLNTLMDIPEIVTGLIGAAFIGFSLVSSRKGL